jgi:hypothetical protein
MRPYRVSDEVFKTGHANEGEYVPIPYVPIPPSVKKPSEPTSSQ